MGAVYPEALWERDDSDTKEYMKEHFGCLQSTLKAVADRGLGSVII
jgi:hypothetical protein